MKSLSTKIPSARFVSTALCAALFFSPAAFSVQQFELTDGSVVLGDILRMDGGVYYVQMKDGSTRRLMLTDVKEITNPNVPSSVVNTMIAQDKNLLRLHGSNTVGAQLAPALVSAYAELRSAQAGPWQNTSVENERVLPMNSADSNIPSQVELHAHGSSTGFASLLAGKADIGMASRRVKEKEVTQLSSLDNMRAPGVEHVVGLDGVAVIVNESNPVKTLSSEQIKRVFDCTLTDWSQLGGTPGPISLYARDSKSGTLDTFKSLVMQKKAVCEKAARFESSEKLSQAVSADANGIGFVGLSDVGQSRPLNIEECGLAYPPTSFTIRAEEYPLARRLYMYTPKSARTPFVEGFMNFVKSPEGQKLVTKSGYISLDLQNQTLKVENDLALLRVRESMIKSENYNVLKGFVANTQDAERLSVTFRFEPGTTVLDNRSTSDLARLSKFMDRPEWKNGQLMVFGFADSVGEYFANLKLSEQRAAIVADQLKALGTSVTLVKGYGEEAPIACNTSKAGKEKNRHVEIWVKKGSPVTQAPTSKPAATPKPVSEGSQTRLIDQSIAQVDMAMQPVPPPPEPVVTLSNGSVLMPQ